MVLQRIRWIAPLFVLVLLLVACAPEGLGMGAAPESTPTPAATYQNPVYNRDFPDPFVLRVDEDYYAYATNVGNVNVPTLHSTDLVNWRLVGNALPILARWAASEQQLTWAPGVLQREDSFILYYTARFIKGGRQCISLAVSDRPEGPYKDDSTEPFICQLDLGGSIDPHPFVDDDGRVYLYWKNDGNCCGKPVGLWVQELSDDGLTLVGEPVELIRRDQLWEHPLIENPAMWKEDGQYYLLYSGNWWASHEYAVGYALCETVTGPCEKPLRKPIFAYTKTVMGPGGQMVFSDTSGNLWMAYHAWTAPHVTYPEGLRSLRIDPITFEDDKPVIHGPTDTPQPLH
jgi:beta-xylosidase